MQEVSDVHIWKHVISETKNDVGPNILVAEAKRSATVVNRGYEVVFVSANKACNSI